MGEYACNYLLEDTHIAELSILWRLQRKSYEWALRHLVEEGDSDLFPAPFEIEVIRHGWPKILSDRNWEIETPPWNPGRRFVIPKEALAFRTATKLDPFDSVILAALNVRNRTSDRGASRSQAR